MDKTTEEWLDSIERRLSYGAWYCGHYHVDSQEGPVRVMYQDFEELEGMTDHIHDDGAMELLLSLSPERRKEIDAILQKSKEKLRRNGLKGMMTLEEFEEHMNEKFRELGLMEE